MRQLYHGGDVADQLDLSLTGCCRHDHPLDERTYELDGLGPEAWISKRRLKVRDAPAIDLSDIGVHPDYRSLRICLRPGQLGFPGFQLIEAFQHAWATDTRSDRLNQLVDAALNDLGLLFGLGARCGGGSTFSVYLPIKGVDELLDVLWRHELVMEAIEDYALDMFATDRSLVRAFASAPCAVAPEVVLTDRCQHGPTLGAENPARENRLRPAMFPEPALALFDRCGRVPDGAQAICNAAPKVLVHNAQVRHVLNNPL